jgi:hypothetical protein
MRELFNRISSSAAPAETVLVRLLVGGVFLTEGIQKFLYPEALGAGRFAKIGIPAPAFIAPFVGVVHHTIIVGVGGATELELADRSLHPGANLMVEWDAIENWLELEIGASVLSANRGVEAPIDLLIKKPFKLAPWAEFMVGVGPEVVLVSNPTTKATYFGGEVALDFMFWPWGRRVGLWVEPEYDLVFDQRGSSGIGATGGVLFGW